MNRPRGTSGSDGSDLVDASTVLLLAPTIGGIENEGCTRLVAPTAARDAAVLSVTLTETPDDRLDVWRARADWDPARIGFVGVGDPARSVPAGDVVSDPGGPIRVSTVSDPGDLTGLGIEISRFLGAWSGEGATIVCCFHSLTALLQYVDPDAAFRFLEVVTGRLETVGARAHFHLDPTAVDDRTVDALSGIFDVVLEHRDGGWTVDGR